MRSSGGLLELFLGKSGIFLPPKFTFDTRMQQMLNGFSFGTLRKEILWVI
jgi:hypothetical protein